MGWAGARAQVRAACRPLLAWPSLVWAGLLAGTLLVAYSYADAAAATGGQSYYHIFWLGVFLFMAPACVRLCAGSIARAERLGIVAAVGLYNCLPKFLRTPQSPLFHDELAHWRQSELVYKLGHVFLPSPTVDMSQFYPGLQSATVAVRELSGLSTFQIATMLIAVLHIIAVIGVFVIAERVTRSAQVAGIAAFLYSLNPSFMFFDTEYSYESMAIVFLIWAIAAVVNMQEAAGDRPRQLAWCGVGALLAAACIVTHHLSSFILSLLLLVIAVVTWLRARRGLDTPANARLTAVFALVVTACTAAWVIFVAPRVLEYLGTPFADGLQQLQLILEHKQASRTLFAQSTTPLYEHLSAFASPLLALAGAAGGLYLLRRERSRLSAGLALALFGLLYFPSIPIMLTSAGSEGARRSWAFSYIGLAILVAPVIASLLRWMETRASWARLSALGGTAAVLAVVLVGNVSMHVNELYRFPGPYIYGSDTRSITPSLLTATQWFKKTQGSGLNVVADRYTGLTFSSFGFDWTSQAAYSFPVWQLYFTARPLSSFLLGELESSNYRYMVVDTDGARQLPYIGVYFERDEPDAIIRSTHLSMATITRFEKLPWTIKIFQSGNLNIYRFDFKAYHLRTAALTRGLTLKCHGRQRTLKRLTERYGAPKGAVPCQATSVAGPLTQDNPARAARAVAGLPVRSSL